MKDVLEYAKTQTMKFLVDDRGRGKGYMQLANCSMRNSYTFIDLMLQNKINLVPVVAVDFSLANLTFDEN